MPTIIDLTIDEPTPAAAKRASAADLPMEKELASRACRTCTLVTSDATRTRCEVCECELPELPKRRSLESFFFFKRRRLASFFEWQSPPPPPSPTTSPTPTLTPTATPVAAPAPATPTPTLTPTPTPTPPVAAPAPATPTPMPTPAPGETAGWHVNLSGRLQPYPQCAQLVLEHAWERGLPKASVTVDGVGTFDVRFNAAGGAATGGAGTGPHLPVAVQCGRAQQRNVHRVPPSPARPEPPLLADARRVARITCADEVGKEWALLAQAAAELEEARRRVAARRGAWVEEAKQWRALEGKKVAVVGSFLIGDRGVLRDVLVGAGAGIPTHAQPAEKKVNSKTDLLLVGGALTAQCAADAVAVGRALREVNSKRGGTKAKPPCQRLDEVGLASLTLT